MVVGAGGVGTMAAVALEKSQRATVTAVLRSNYSTVLEKGFEIESVDYGKILGWKPSSSACIQQEEWGFERHLLILLQLFRMSKQV